MDLNFTNNNSTSIPSLAEFQAKLKKKYNKKNEIQQISEFNTKSISHSNSQKISSSSFNQADFKSSKTQVQMSQKEDFFEEEGKKLLGQQQSTKQLCLKIVLVDFIVHISLFLMSLNSENSKILMVGNFLMLVLNLYILSEKKLKFSNEFRINVYKFYHILLMISIVCLSINLFYSVLLKQNKAGILNLLLFVLSFIGIGCELKLLKQTKYVVFMSEQLNKKQSLEDMDLSDQI